MRISEMIEKLTELQNQYGDLRCVTPGFDETDIDDVEFVDIVDVVFRGEEKGSRRGFGHSGRHIQIEDWNWEDYEGVEIITKAVSINF